MTRTSKFFVGVLMIGSAGSAQPLPAYNSSRHTHIAEPPTAKYGNTLEDGTHPKNLRKN